MKKNIFALFLVLVLLFTSACSLKGQFKDEADVTSEEGILTEQKVTDKLGGSHILTLENAEKLPLRSLTIDMSQDEYLGNKVSVIGFVNEDDSVFEVTGISVLEILSPAGGVGKLISYKNSDLGFTLKFYDDWRFEESENEVVFYAPGSDDAKEVDRIIVEQVLFDYSPTINADGTQDNPLYLYFATTGSSVEYLNKAKNKVGLDQLDSIRMDYDLNVITYFVYRTGFIYEISFAPALGVVPVSEKNTNIFMEMLADFQFIGFSVDSETSNDDANDGSDLELSDFEDMELATFQSLPFKFQGSYPADWYYAGVKSSQPGVLHHYAFSNESVTDENELVSLDIISGAIPAGDKLKVSGKSLTVVESSSGYTIYVSVGDQNFRVSGDSEYKDIVTVIAASISAISDSE